MKKNKKGKLALITVMIFGLITFQQSCKKTDSIGFKNSQTEKKFLLNHSPNDKDLQLVITDFKNHLATKDFSEYFVKNNGQPLWDKAVKSKDAQGNFVLLIPTKQFGCKSIATFFAAKSSNGVLSYEIHRKQLSIVNKHEPSQWNWSPADINSLFKYLDLTIENKEKIKKSYSSQNLKNNNTSSFGDDCVLIEDWYNPDGDACNCNGDEYWLGTSHWEGNCDFSVPVPIHSTIEGGTGDGINVIFTWGWDPIGGGSSGGSGGSPTGGPHNPWYNFPDLQLIPLEYLDLADHLDAALQPGDTYEFNSNLDPANSLNFATVAEFQNYISNFSSVNSVVLDQPNQKIVKAHLNTALIGGIDIFVKLEKNPSTGKYSVSETTSDEWGATLSWSWTQSNYSVAVTSTQIFVDIYGKENYNVFLEGIGTIYKKARHYRIKIDILTGDIITVIEI